MLAFCTCCWLEMQSDAAVCPHCGAKVDDDPRAYEEKLKGALQHPLPSTRARICWLFGQRADPAGTPHLLLMLKDGDLYVRIAALRALGKIGGSSVLSVLEKAANNPSLIIRLAARQALEAARMQGNSDPRRVT